MAEEIFERLLEIDRAAVNKEEGTFNSTLATSGEASDGHIISIKGLRIPARMPLLFGHRSEAMVPVLGSVTNPEKSTEKGLERLRITAKVNLNGEGPLSDIRRGMFQLIADGDIRAMSLRWVGERVKRRTELPPDHPAYVDKEKTDFEDPRRWGLFFEKSLGLEGSIVALGADPKALMGRSDTATTEHERIFLRSLARSAESNADESGDVTAALQAVEAAVAGLRDVGCEAVDIVNLLGGSLDSGRFFNYTYQDGGEERTIHLPPAAYEQLIGESHEVYRAALALHDVGVRRKPDDDTEPAPEPVRREPIKERVIAAPGTLGALTEEQLVEAVGRAVGSAMEGVAYSVFGKVK